MLGQLLQSGVQGQGINADVLGQLMQSGVAGQGVNANMAQALMGGGLQGIGMGTDFTQNMAQNLMGANTANQNILGGLAGDTLGAQTQAFGIRQQDQNAALSALASMYGSQLGAQTDLANIGMSGANQWMGNMADIYGTQAAGESNWMNQLGLQQDRALDYSLGLQQNNLGMLGAANDQAAMRMGFGGQMEGREMDRINAALQAAGVGRMSNLENLLRESDYVQSIITGLPVSNQARMYQTTRNERDWAQFGGQMLGTVIGAVAGGVT
jgi:hypothetical protein